MSKTWTPEELEAQAHAIAPHGYCDGHAEGLDCAPCRASSMLRQAAASARRWETLKAGVNDIHAHWSSFHSVAPAAVENVRSLIARLEREP